MSKKRTGDEVGYGKPPKDSQFEKGVSGNPKGRPKKCRNFDEVLIRESESLMSITENGQRKRLSKHEVVVKQLLKQAMTGNIQAARIYLALLQLAHERVALVTGSQQNYPGKFDDVRYLTDEELMILAAGPEKPRQEIGQEHRPARAARNARVRSQD